MIPTTFDEVTEVYLAVRRREPRFPGFCYGLLYATQSARRRRVAVPYNYGVQKISSVNDLFVHVWVHRTSRHPSVVDLGAGRLTVSTLPGSAVPLEFTYSIIYVPPTFPLPNDLNNCADIRARADWYGNILVVKHGKRKAIINMESEDTFLVDSIVGACIDGGLLV